MSADIGTVGVTGSADETSGTFTIEGGGANIGGTEDAFHFVYQTLYGDGSITANVASLSGGGTTPRAGLMMRDGLAADAAHVSAVVQGNRIRLLDRASTGGNTTDALGHNQGAPEWIRIERSGSTFTLSRSNDGSSWAVMDTRTISMGTIIYIGMAVTGNSTTTLATGVFDNVATTGSGATPTPTATNTPLPTNTPTATNTPVSTNTPTPTNTPAPSPTPAPDVWVKRSSYSIAGQTVAFRVTGDPANSGLFYVLSDHLGSTSLLVNSSGGTVTGSTTRYLPFGGYRGTAPSQSITDRDFTGQKENRELGLLYYQARFYVPGIGRFASADTIIPNPGNPQSFNRFSYVLNSPVNLIDPTGHCEIGTDEHGNNIITKWDCTVGDFDKLSWDERKLWMELFMQETGHAWFYNILGILDYFANDNDFAGSAWASYSDAGVLQAINDGWRISGRGEAAIGTWVYTGGSGTVSYANAGSEWAIFFEMLARGNELSDLDAVRAQWGIAEQAGVDYGLLVANPFYNTASSGERGKIDYFVYWGNTYRSMVENQAWNWDEAGHGFIMRKVINTFTDKPLDPRTTTSQNFVKNFSSLVISGTYEIVR